MRRHAPTRSRRLHLLLAVCLLLAVLSTVGLVAGHLFSLEIAIGPGIVDGMVGLGIWRGTAYLVALGEDRFWWFELKFEKRNPHGSGGFGCRWFWDPQDQEYGIGIPLWLTTPLLWWLSWSLWKRRRAVLPGLCRKCHYDLRATPGRCPECGTVALTGGQAVA